MTEEVVRELYLNQELPREEVARRLGVTHPALKRFLTKHGIRRNNTNQTFGEVRICPSCQVMKDPVEFYVSTRKDPKTNTMILRPGSWCKTCMNTQVVRRQQMYKQEIVDLKGGCCQYCGFKEYIGALEFHHLDPNQKDIDISSLSRSKKDKKLLDELDKCVLLCSNHHKMVHAGLIELKI